MPIHPDFPESPNEIPTPDACWSPSRDFGVAVELYGSDGLWYGGAGALAMMAMYW